MQWNIQARNITTNLKVKIGFTLPALSATNAITWNCHVYDSAKGRYDIILGRDLLTELGPFNSSTTPMVDFGTYIFQYFNTSNITPEESFTNADVKELY